MKVARQFPAVLSHKVRFVAILESCFYCLSYDVIKPTLLTLSTRMINGTFNRLRIYLKSRMDTSILMPVKFPSPYFLLKELENIIYIFV